MGESSGDCGHSVGHDENEKRTTESNNWIGVGEGGSCEQRGTERRCTVKFRVDLFKPFAPLTTD